MLSEYKQPGRRFARSGQALVCVVLVACVSLLVLLALGPVLLASGVPAGQLAQVLPALAGAVGVIGGAACGGLSMLNGAYSLGQSYSDARLYQYGVQRGPSGTPVPGE